jgi:hypothetical protein
VIVSTSSLGRALVRNELLLIALIFPHLLLSTFSQVKCSSSLYPTVLKWSQKMLSVDKEVDKRRQGFNSRRLQCTGNQSLTFDTVRL